MRAGVDGLGLDGSGHQGIRWPAYGYTLRASRNAAKLRRGPTLLYSIPRYSLGGTVTMAVKSLSKRKLRKGDLLRVRSADEILATLDSDGTVDGLLFMPEMLQYAGREFRVQSSAHKTCDGAAGIRRMDNTVHLEGLRCDGSAHGGCQAGCQLFWREEWLRPASEPQPAASAMTDESAMAILNPNTRTTNDCGESVYRCQATDVRRASRPLSQYDPRQYVRDLTSGNVTFRVFLVGLAVYAFKKYQLMTRRVLSPWLRIHGGKPYPFYQGTGTGARTPIVDVAPGQLVEIRKKDEIMPTLSPENRNRNMLFDSEMVPFCGTRARVNRHVQRIIDESTGKMIKLGDCVVLDDVVCQGIYHRFCQRGIDIYWRSAWLRPQNGTDDDQLSV
jgi:hypothetical protein